MKVKSWILVGTLIVIGSLIRTFLGFDFVCLFLLVVFLPPFLFWLPLSKLSGSLLLDLGRPRNRLLIVIAIICGLAGIIKLADLLLDYHAGTAHLRNLSFPVFFLFLMTLFILAHRRRGLSIREEGILDSGTLFRWQEFASYTFEEGTDKLTVHVNGVGLLHAFVSPRPPSCVKTWSIPTELRAAVRQILAQRVPTQAAEASAGRIHS
jgi:hypothetical protein